MKTGDRIRINDTVHLVVSVGTVRGYALACHSFWYDVPRPTVPDVVTCMVCIAYEGNLQ